MIKLGRKNIIIQKNINKIKEDFKNLTKDKIFLGNIDENIFTLFSKNRSTIIFQGKLSPISSNETNVKIQIFISLMELIIWIIYYIIVLIIYFKVNFDSVNTIFKIIFLVIIFLAPLLNILLPIKKMFKILDKYNKGYYINYKEKLNINSDYSNERFVNKLKEKL
jgi:hypothetical protein